MAPAFSFSVGLGSPASYLILSLSKNTGPIAKAGRGDDKARPSLHLNITVSSPFAMPTW
ncbi:hypothetical protein [Mesorhizobium sp. M7A.F.Ca.CA.004.12.1.1]|uniref:hypothetical protein n=1 Tax=Mesorhizobium sp. M7A.F.Ca.CA.004.12.1.1 TaxID=2496732 RepID=UPI0019D0FA1A|nr:hypothetical protein [Mesorhizobium sp. M7A.F.Ca.CA.004.12.1.1]